MRFTGRNLMLVYEALDLALSEVHNQIATCPDVDRYADDLDALEDQQEALYRLRARVYKRLTPEQVLQLTAPEEE